MSPISNEYFFLCIALMALSSFLSRTSFILLSGKIDLNERIHKALSFLPVAAFTAIFAPAVIYTRGAPDLEINLPQIIAGSIALVIALRTQNVYYTLLGGMVSLWALRYFL